EYYFRAESLQLDSIHSARLIQIYLVTIALLVAGLFVALFYLFYKEKRLATELKSKSVELRELNISKDKFFSIIAHDLKNPFSVLVSYTSLLKSDLKLFSEEELKQIISDLNSASENGFNLLQNLLLWTRSQTKRIHVFKTNFQLIEIIENVKALVDLNLIDKAQRLEIETENNLMVYADKDMVATVFRNLIFNAVKFSPKGSLIMIKAFSTDSYVQIDVIDNGVGIPSGSIGKLFSIENNSATHGTEGEPGSGLGLVLCQEFVVKNNGKIWVESTPGKGSVFSFTLPLSK
ncbi:MAG: HAMP domain-containing sensor histidine kinase, partial [Bacteroidota bacterium]|nr:HAMP domain-containing sensor histidine kinase [Bacteroidota bacterium]